jgi:hypothetical protein
VGRRLAGYDNKLSDLAKTVKEAWDKYSSPLRVGSVFFNILKDDQSDDPVQKLVEFLQVDGKAVSPKERKFVGISHGVTEWPTLNWPTRLMSVNWRQGSTMCLRHFTTRRIKGDTMHPIFALSIEWNGEDKDCHELCAYYNTKDNKKSKSKTKQKQGRILRVGLFFVAVETVEKRKGRRKRRCLTISSISTTINIADNCFKM